MSDGESLNPSPDFLSLDVGSTPLQRISYHGAPVDIRILHRSADGRHTTFYGEVPEGVRFTESAAALEETFYMIEGTITCTPKGGKTIVWGPGELVYWPYEVEMELEYSVGMKCICFFWSDEELPDFSTGDEV